MPEVGSSLMGKTQGSSQGLTFCCYGVTVAFRSSSEELLAAIDPDFIPAAVPACDCLPADLAYFLEARRQPGRYAAWTSSEHLIENSDLHLLLETVKEHVHQKLAEIAVEKLFLHAGAVAWRGGAILFPGRSHTGKSTLVRTLVSAGAVYLSDEFAVLDNRGLVHPFARPISLRTPAGRIRCRPSDFGGRTATEALPVSLVVFTSFNPHETFRPQYLSQGRAVLEILKHIVAVRANPKKAMHLARAVTAKSLVITSPRGNACSTADAIFEIVDRSSTRGSNFGRLRKEVPCIQSPEQRI
jgi:hypothetical protein